MAAGTTYAGTSKPLVEDDGSGGYRPQVSAVVTAARSGAHTTNTSIDTAVTLTPPAGASSLLIQALAQNVRYRLDGTDPTTTTGFRMTAGNDPILIPVSTGGTVHVISETAGAKIEYQWFA